MNLRGAIARHKFRYMAAAAAVASVAVLGLAQTAASATTFNTMKPIGTNYCVADLNGGRPGYASLVNGCPDGSAQAWGTTYSPYGDSTYEIFNEYTGLCLETDGGGVKLYMATCNGDEAQSWIYNEVTSTETVWTSPYTKNGTNYCADANATYGVRAELCNGTNAQIWNGPTPQA